MINSIKTAALGKFVPTILILATFFAFNKISLAQGTKSDYQRANNYYNKMRNKIYKYSVRPNWFGSGRYFWYSNSLKEGNKEFVVVDAEKGVRKAAFDHQWLAKALADASKQRVNAKKLPFRTLRFKDNPSQFQFRALGQTWQVDVEKKELKKAGQDKKKSDAIEEAKRSEVNIDDSQLFEVAQRPATAAVRRKYTAYIKNYNVYIKNRETEKEHQLTTNGSAKNYYNRQFYWSPDATKLVVMRTEPAQRHTVYMVESSPRNQKQPKLHSFNYLKPGDKIRKDQPHLFDLEKKSEIKIDNKLFTNPWSLGQLRWKSDSSRFTFFYNQRGHQVLRVIAVDGKTGEAKSIINEESKTFIDYSRKQYKNYLRESEEIIWSSERDGWNHLYLYDAEFGKVKNQITKGKWVVRRIDHVDAKKRQIWFQASGIYPKQDPYYIHYCRVHFDGSGLTFLTAGDGTHRISYSRDRKYIIDSYSRVDMPPVTELRKVSDGSLVCQLEKADTSELLTAGWKVPERFVSTGRDGKTKIYGVMFRPTNFDPKKKYPVIEKIYAGPHGAFVPKRFRSTYDTQALAELGFIVVQIDGMGTSNRSKAFHDVCWKNLGDSGFPDRILWIKALGKKYSFLDLNRVGIYGGSAGGQSSTRALMAFGDFYKVAVSDCGCHDNLMDKIWWNEQWMGWPIGPHYKEQSNVTGARNLKGKLFLIVGEMDRNVDPASTMQVVNALIKADKDFDLLVVPGGGHGIAESRYGKRRRRDFFVRHLLNVEPRSKP